MKRLSKLVSALLIMALAVTILAVPVPAQETAVNPLAKPAAAPVYKNWAPLSYQLEYNESAHELALTVKSNYFWPVYLTFPSAKKFDFAVFDSKGNQVWRYSNGKFYTQAATGQWLYSGQARKFTAELPKLAPGKYQAKAYFYAWGNKAAVASVPITIAEKADVSGLKVDAWYRGGTQPHIVLALNNQTKKNLTLRYPTSKKYDVVLIGDNGFYWQYSNGKKFDKAVHTEQLKAGVYRSHYIYLPEKLPRGNYTAYVYFLERSYYDLVKAIKFKV